MNPFRTMSGEAVLTLSRDISLKEAARRESDERILTELGLIYDGQSHAVTTNDIAHVRLCDVLIARGQDTKLNGDRRQLANGKFKSAGAALTAAKGPELDSGPRSGAKRRRVPPASHAH